MKVLAVDVGSSSVKAALLAGGRILGRVAHEPVRTTVAPSVVEIPAEPLWASVARAVRSLGPSRLASVDRISLGALSPSCVVLDRTGAPLTPLITHQDRRSIAEALAIERRFGRAEHLRLAGNRPFPGGIASTTLLWLRRHAPGILRRAATVGMGTTYLVHRLTGARTIDPGNAAFLGLRDLPRRRRTGETAWSRELCAPSGVTLAQLPEILDGGEVAGRLLPGPARRLGLRSGIEVLAGVVDTSAAFLGVGAEPGRLLNVIGTTDVIALSSRSPAPHARVLTRELGTGESWLTVFTIACGGGAVRWAREALFPDLPEEDFYALARKVAHEPPPRVRFRPYLAGDRMSIRQKEAGFDGLDLRTTRRDLLGAILHALARWNGEGMEHLTRRAKPLPDVYVSGGGGWLADLLHATWPGKWRFHALEGASLLGLEALANKFR